MSERPEAAAVKAQSPREPSPPRRELRSGGALVERSVNPEKRRRLMFGLMLLRHGKSDWKADDGDDRARPLARRGQKAARTMGRLMARADQAPDLALSSPARRAQQTLQLAMEAGGWTCPVRSSDALYSGGVDGLLEELRGQPPSAHLLLAVGHEPTWSETAAALIGGGRLRLPTGGLARIDLDVDRWDQIRSGAGVLAWIVTPRLLAGTR